MSISTDDIRNYSVEASERNTHAEHCSEVVLDAPPEILPPDDGRTLTMDEWLDSLCESDREFIESRIDGKEYGELSFMRKTSMAEVYSLPRRITDNRPVLLEEPYLYFARRYDLDAQEFMKITGMSRKLYDYARLIERRWKLLKLPLEDALCDDDVSEKIKQQIKDYLERDFINIGAERVPLKRREIYRALVQELDSDEHITIGQLVEKYNHIVDEHADSDLKRDSTDAASLRKVSDMLGRLPGVLVIPPSERGYGNAIVLHYEPDPGALDQLNLMIQELEKRRDLEVSANLFLKPTLAFLDFLGERDAVAKRLDVMARLRIVDGRMLWSVISKYIKKRPKMGSIPMLIFGQGDRDKQVYSLLRELTPVSRDDLAKAYEERYGVPAETVKASYLKAVESYRMGDRYVCGKRPSSAKLNFLKQRLRGLYHPLPLLESQISEAFPGSKPPVLDKTTLKALKLSVSRQLVYRNAYGVSGALWNRIHFTPSFSFDDEGFGVEVWSHPAFKAEVNACFKKLELVEISPGTMIHTSLFAKREDPMTKNDLRDFVEQVIEFMEPEQGYTARRLKKLGFSHPVMRLQDECGFEDCFLESLLMAGTTHGRLRMASIQGTKIFAISSHTYTSKNFLSEVIRTMFEDRDSIALEDLQSALLEDYGIKVGRSNLRNLVTKVEGVMYARGTDMISV